MKESTTASPEATAKAIALNNSTPLDVHRWSDHPAINIFVDGLYERIGKPHNISERRAYRTLKMLMLNLYVAHKTDPARYVDYSRGQNTFVPGSRYNALHIERKPLIYYIDKLNEKGMLDDHKGYFYTKGNMRNKRSRMKAATPLAIRFNNLSDIPIEKHPDFETIILKDKNKKRIEYGKEVNSITGKVRCDPPIVASYRKRLVAINQLYKQTDISCDMTSDKFTAYNARLAAEDRPIVDLFQKRLYRVFNDGKFNLGGRFYGGWWQNAPKELRKVILINGEKTVERDYKAIHPSIIYIKETGGLPDGDPYEVPGYVGNKIVRKFLKKATLSMMNALTYKKGLKAANNDLTKSKKFTMDEKSLIRSIGINKLLILHKETHPVFWKYMGKDMGKKLQYWDSQIAESVLIELTNKRIPCLPVHDSFITEKKHEAILIEAMKQAFITKYNACPVID